VAGYYKGLENYLSRNRGCDQVFAYFPTNYKSIFFECGIIIQVFSRKHATQVGVEKYTDFLNDLIKIVTI